MSQRAKDRPPADRVLVAVADTAAIASAPRAFRSFRSVFVFVVVRRSFVAHAP